VIRLTRWSIHRNYPFPDRVNHSFFFLELADRDYPRSDGDHGPARTPPPRDPALERLLGQIAPGASERERDRVAPFAEIGLIKEARLGAIRVPVAEGGGGATLRQLFEVLMALAEADSNVAHILRVHFSYVERLLDEPDPGRRARWTAVVNEGKIFGNAISEPQRLLLAARQLFFMVATGP
jgi:alkylation response protein AidB-like acyl-CoA dehydrogenase